MILLNRNTMQRGTDNFSFNRRALLKSSSPWRLKGETQIVGFTAKGTQPDGSNRRVIFEIDNNFWYFTEDGLKEFPYHAEIADILQHGNTIAELLQVNGIAKWLNKDVYPLIALESPRNAPVMPKLKLGLRVNCFNDEYTRTELSNVYELKTNGSFARILEIVCHKSTKGYGKVDVQIRLRDNVGDWSDWLNFNDALDKQACAVQFKATYVLTTLDGTDEAKVIDCTVEYSTDFDNSAVDVLEIFTSPLKGTENIGVVRALIKHTELFDAEISASIQFSSPVKRRENIIIGRGTGAIETYYLGINGGIDPNINHNTLRITADGQRVTDFYYDTATATVKFAAVNNAEILASYEYGLTSEEWLPMTFVDSQPYGETGLFISRFYYRLPNSANEKNATVKFTLTRKKGKVTAESLGNATGYTQSFLLPHRAKTESIILNGSWQYDEDSQILTVTSFIGDSLVISYDWTGIIPNVDSFTVGAEFVV